MKINHYFDQVYCINLVRRKDRWKKINSQFKKMNIKVRRINAVDSLIFKDIKGTKKQKARFACTESHKMAIQDAKKNAYEKILIFEDDCIFSKGFNSIISKRIKEIPSDWEFLLLGYYAGPNFPKEKYSKDSFFKIPRNKTKLDGLWAAHAYALKKSLYDEILSSKNGAFSENPHADSGEGYGCIDIMYYYQLYGHYNCYALNPSLVSQEKNDSDIDE